MTAGTFQVRYPGPDRLVYEHGTGQALSFDCTLDDGVPQLRVPATERWRASLPVWSHAPRELIVARLRGAGCTVFELGDHQLAVRSPDGGLRIEQTLLCDGRSGPWETTRIIETADGAAGETVLLEVLSLGSDSRLRFAPGGRVTLSLTDRRNARRLVCIDTRARCFRLLPDGPDQALDQLDAALGLHDPPPAWSGLSMSPRRARWPALAGLVSSLVLSSGGLWMVLAGQTTKDRWIGVLGLLCFGACALQYGAQWRRRR